MNRSEISEQLKEELRMFVLTRASIRLFNQATKEFSVSRLYYYFKRELMREYPELMMTDLWFSVIMCESFKPYQVNDVECTERRQKIDKLMRNYKLYPKYHAERTRIANEHDALVIIHNESIKPQNDLIKLFKKIQRKKKTETV